MRLSWIIQTSQEWDIVLTTLQELETFSKFFENSQMEYGYVGRDTKHLFISEFIFCSQGYSTWLHRAEANEFKLVGLSLSSSSPLGTLLHADLNWKHSRITVFQWSFYIQDQSIFLKDLHY